MKRGIWLVLIFLFITMPMVLAKKQASIMDVILGATEESAVLLKILYAALIYIIIFKTTKETVFKDSDGKHEQHRFAVMFSLIISLIVMRFTPDAILTNFGWVAGILGPILIVFFIMRGITGEKAKDGEGKFPWKATIATLVICLLAFIALYAFDPFPSYISGMPLVGYALDELFSDIFYLSFFKFAPLLAFILVGLLIWGIVALAKGSGGKDGGGFTMPNGKWLLWALGIILGIALLLFLLSGGGGLLGLLATVLSGIWAYGLYGLAGLLLLAMVIGLIYLLWKYRAWIWNDFLKKLPWKWIFIVLGIILGLIFLLFTPLGWVIILSAFLAAPIWLLWKYRQWIWDNVLKANIPKYWLWILLGLGIVILLVLAILGYIPWWILVVAAIIALIIWLIFKYPGGIKNFFKKVLGDWLWDKFLKSKRLRYIIALEDGGIVESRGRSIIGWFISIGGNLPLDFFRLAPGSPRPTTRWSRITRFASSLVRSGRVNRLTMNPDVTRVLDFGVYEGVSKFMAVENATVQLMIDNGGQFVSPAAGGGGALVNTITLNTGRYGIDHVMLRSPNTNVTMNLHVVSVTAPGRENGRPQIFPIDVGTGGAGPGPTPTPGTNNMIVTVNWMPDPSTSNRHMLMNFMVVDAAGGGAVNGARITINDTHTNPINIAGGVTHTTQPTGTLSAPLRIDLSGRAVAPGNSEVHELNIRVSHPTLGMVRSPTPTPVSLTFYPPRSRLGGPRTATF